MQNQRIQITLVLVQAIIIIFGGYLYSLIPLEPDLGPCESNTLNNRTNSSSLATTPSLSDSIFFVITTVTTIGYGQLTPKSDIGKIFTIFVAFIGIPINILFLAKLGESFKGVSARLLKPLQKCVKEERRFIAIQLCLSIVVGTIGFLFLPGFIIMTIEGWSYMDSIYYIFVTLFTIGFGDYVAGSTIRIGSGWLVFYRFSLYTWMFLGMAYISLIINICLDFFKSNAESLKRELVNIIEEKVNLSIKRYQQNRKAQKINKKKLATQKSQESTTSKSTSISKQAEASAADTFEVKITNIDHEKLEALAMRRIRSRNGSSMSRISSNIRRKLSLINQGFELNESDGGPPTVGKHHAQIQEEDEVERDDQEPTVHTTSFYLPKEDDQIEAPVAAKSIKDRKKSVIILEKKRDRSPETMMADDDCLKIDIEEKPSTASKSLDRIFGSSYYDTVNTQEEFFATIEEEQNRK